MVIRTMGLIGGANPANLVEQLQKAVLHITSEISRRTAELAETGYSFACSEETLVVDKKDRFLTD